MTNGWKALMEGVGNDDHREMETRMAPIRDEIATWGKDSEEYTAYAARRIKAVTHQLTVLVSRRHID